MCFQREEIMIYYSERPSQAEPAFLQIAGASKCQCLAMDTRMGHPNGTPEWDTRMGHPNGTPEWDTRMGHPNGTPEWDTRMGHPNGTPEWDTRMGHRIGAPEWTWEYTREQAHESLTPHAEPPNPSICRLLLGSGRGAAVASTRPRPGQPSANAAHGIFLEFSSLYSH